jgi:hypothetical protein
MDPGLHLDELAINKCLSSIPNFRPRSRKSNYEQAQAGNISIEYLQMEHFSYSCCNIACRKPEVQFK